MRRLMLLRHAKTEHDAPSGRDQDRRLDHRGHGDATEIGGWIARHRPFPNTVLVSHAIRAHQTWEVAWQAMKDLVPKPVVELMPELYGADAAELLQIIRHASEADPQRLLLVGHNPGLQEVGEFLIAAGEVELRERLREKFPTAALAVIDFAIGRWNRVHERSGRLDRYVTPRMVAAATK